MTISEGIGVGYTASASDVTNLVPVLIQLLSVLCALLCPVAVSAACQCHESALSGWIEHMNGMPLHATFVPLSPKSLRSHQKSFSSELPHCAKEQIPEPQTVEPFV